MENKREIWIDLLKVVSSFLVILLHSIINGLDHPPVTYSLILYYIGVFAVPIFFMINGYLQLDKTYSYNNCIKKIKNILIACFMWSTFIVILIKGHRIVDIFYNVCLGFLQEGFLWHFWFLGALAILYAFLPIFQKLFKTHKLYYVITILLIFICISIDLLNIYLNHNGYGIIKDNVCQIFRLWTWITYYFIGGCIKKGHFQNKKIVNIYSTLFVIVIAIIYQFLLSYTLYSNRYAESFYDSYIIIGCVTMIFATIKNIKVKKTFLTKLAPYTLGVYLIHPLIIDILKQTILFGDNIINLIWSIGIFCLCILFTSIIYKIPLINRSVKI